MLSHVTTAMEVGAVLLLVLAAALAVAAWSVPAAVATAGAGLLAGSWGMTWAARPKGGGS